MQPIFKGRTINSGFQWDFFVGSGLKIYLSWLRILQKLCWSFLRLRPSCLNSDVTRGKIPSRKTDNAGHKIWKMSYITFILVMGDLTDHDLQTWDMRPHCVQTRDHPWRSLHQRWAEQTSALPTFFARANVALHLKPHWCQFRRRKENSTIVVWPLVHNYDQHHLVSISMLWINTCPFNTISKIQAVNHDRLNFFSQQFRTTISDEVVAEVHLEPFEYKSDNQ